MWVRLGHYLYLHLTSVQKNKKVRTVVNKLNTIDNQFRIFEMEVIAGEPDFIVEHVRTSFLP
jgi:tRNA G37 N-methylase Trm5